MTGWQVIPRILGRIASSQPIVGVQATGTLSLNQAAFDALGRPAHVFLMITQLGGKRIGIQAAQESAVTRPVRRQGATHSYLVSAAPALFAAGYVAMGSKQIPPGRFAAQMTDGVLAVDFSNWIQTFDGRADARDFALRTNQQLVLALVAIARNGSVPELAAGLREVHRTTHDEGSRIFGERCNDPTYGHDFAAEIIRAVVGTP